MRLTPSSETPQSSSAPAASVANPCPQDPGSTVYKHSTQAPSSSGARPQEPVYATLAVFMFEHHLYRATGFRRRQVKPEWRLLQRQHMRHHRLGLHFPG